MLTMSSDIFTCAFWFNSFSATLMHPNSLSGCTAQLEWGRAFSALSSFHKIILSTFINVMNPCTGILWLPCSYYHLQWESGCWCNCEWPFFKKATELIVVMWNKGKWIERGENTHWWRGRRGEWKMVQNPAWCQNVQKSKGWALSHAVNCQVFHSCNAGMSEVTGCMNRSEFSEWTNCPKDNSPHLTVQSQQPTEQPLTNTSSCILHTHASVA